MRDAIHALKYDRLRPVAVRLGRMLALAIAQLAASAQDEMLVVPVPLHSSKSALRGFNQASLLAEHAVAVLAKSHPHWRLKLAPGIVVRQRATESQAGLTVRQRRLNMRGAFVVPDSRSVSGKHVLVVDDIFTTGATARSVAQVLRRAGAANVCVATLARAYSSIHLGGMPGAAIFERDRHSEHKDGPGEDQEEAGLERQTSNQASF